MKNDSLLEKYMRLRRIMNNIDTVILTAECKLSKNEKSMEQNLEERIVANKEALNKIYGMAAAEQTDTTDQKTKPVIADPSGILLTYDIIELKIPVKHTRFSKELCGKEFHTGCFYFFMQHDKIDEIVDNVKKIIAENKADISVSYMHNVRDAAGMPVCTEEEIYDEVNIYIKCN